MAAFTLITPPFLSFTIHCISDKRRYLWWKLGQWLPWKDDAMGIHHKAGNKAMWSQLPESNIVASVETNVTQLLLNQWASSYYTKYDSSCVELYRWIIHFAHGIIVNQIVSFRIKSNKNLTQQLLHQWASYYFTKT